MTLKVSQPSLPLVAKSQASDHNRPWSSGREIGVGCFVVGGRTIGLVAFHF
jgi:hypothetical protein